MLFNGAFDNRYCCSSTGDGHGCQAPRTCCTTAPLNAIPPENETTRRRRTSVHQQIDGLLGKEWGWEMKGGRGGTNPLNGLIGHDEAALGAVRTESVTPREE